MHVTYSNGNKYLMIFVDDYTRMCWVYLSKKKFKVYETFKSFQVWIENEAQSCIGALHTDNGKEYASNDFENYVHQHGIMHQTIVPYNPHQNDVVEIMNNTLLNMVHSLLFFKNFKLMFWGNVVVCILFEKQMSISCPCQQESI